LRFDQRELDVLGLALIALGAFMGCVLYTHWDGGSAGNGAAHGLAWLFGRVRDGVPVALVGAGALIVLRPLIGSPRPLRASPIFLFAAGTLALAANTLGVAGVGPARHLWQAAPFERRGGIVGQAELWASTHVVGTLGANFIAVFLFLGGVALLSGSSLALAIRSAGAGVADARRRLPAVSELRRPLRDARAGAMPAAIVPPEPTGRELIVRAGHVEAPSNDFFDGSEFEGEDAAPLGGARRGGAHRRAASGGGRSGGADAAGALPRRRHRRSELPVAAAAPKPADALERRAHASGHRRTGRRWQRGWSRRSAISAYGRRSSAPSPARTSRATSCASRPGSRSPRWRR
jgi:hypothetical protein